MLQKINSKVSGSCNANCISMLKNYVELGSKKVVFLNNKIVNLRKEFMDFAECLDRGACKQLRN